jgi:phytanoyl-CoA hydroxylase
VPATIENGCPRIVPGLHRHGTLRHYFVDLLGWECFSELPQTSVPGDVLVFSSLTPHLTGPNLTGEVRKAYMLQYSPVGTMVLEGDPSQRPPSRKKPRASPEPHLPVARDGLRCREVPEQDECD